MQKLLFVFALSALFLTACGNKKDKQNHEGTHTHADGSVHDAHEHDAAPQQEAFKVDSTEKESACSGCPSAGKCSDETKKEHAKEEAHDHDHDHDHSH